MAYKKYTDGSTVYYEGENQKLNMKKDTFVVDSATNDMRFCEQEHDNETPEHD